MDFVIEGRSRRDYLHVADKVPANRQGHFRGTRTEGRAVIEIDGNGLRGGGEQRHDQQHQQDEQPRPQVAGQARAGTMR